MEEEKVDLTTKTVAELKVIATEKGVEINSNMKKVDIIKAIEEV
ncbi:MAG: Rho termination factor N-terminal domain-containing protein [Peptostreptococcaceae bacterium]